MAQFNKNDMLRRSNLRITIGIDEAGRGPLAGPVAVGAFAVRSKRALKMFAGVKNSKQLTANQRERWFELIEKDSLVKVPGGERVSYAVSFSSEKTIDEKGITKAIYLALNRCLKKLETKGFASTDSKILMDGLLKAHSKYLNQKTIIGGDESESIIALASICAKVLRDRKMRRLAKKYPNYDFEIHKGYGTEKHYAAIRKYGLSPIHRKSFL